MALSLPLPLKTPREKPMLSSTTFAFRTTLSANSTRAAPPLLLVVLIAAPAPNTWVPGPSLKPAPKRSKVFAPAPLALTLKAPACVPLPPMCNAPLLTLTVPVLLKSTLASVGSNAGIEPSRLIAPGLVGVALMRVPVLLIWLGVLSDPA